MEDNKTINGLSRVGLYIKKNYFNIELTDEEEAFYQIQSYHLFGKLDDDVNLKTMRLMKTLYPNEWDERLQKRLELIEEAYECLYREITKEGELWKIL